MREQAVGVIQADPTRTMIFEGLTALDNLCFMADRKGKFFWSGHAARASIAREYASVFGEDIYERDVRRLSRRTLYDLVYYRMHLYRPENGALLHEYDREGFCALSKEEGYDPHRTR